MTCFLSHFKVLLLVQQRAQNYERAEGRRVQSQCAQPSGRQARQGGCPPSPPQPLLVWRHVSIDPSGCINVSICSVCHNMKKIRRRSRALFHSKCDLARCCGVSGSIIAPKSKDIVIQVALLCIGCQGHFCDFMTAGRHPALSRNGHKAKHKGRARVCRSWPLGNPSKTKLFSGALHCSL